MTRLEAAAIVFCFAIAAVLALWLIVSQVWGRRRIPERWTPEEPVSMRHLSQLQAEINRISSAERELRDRIFEPKPGAMISVSGDPREILPLPLPPSRPMELYLALTAALDFDFPRTPPSSRPFDHSSPRPWAHG